MTPARPPAGPLARLWRRALLLLALLAAAWAWVWRDRPVWALLGALALLSVHAGVLALQVALMAWHNRRDPAPPVRLVDALRAWFIEAVTAVRVFALWQAWCEWTWPDRPDGPGRRGVVFIHGYVCNRALWQPWYRWLAREQVPFVGVSLAPVFGDIDHCVGQVEAAVRRLERGTGQAPLLVCHSMGGLVARAWLRWQATRPPAPDAGGRVGDARVHHVVTLGTPHAGTWLARFAHTPNGRQMRIGSPWLTALARSEDAARRARFTCFYSHCDPIVFPASTATLPQAQNHHLPVCPHLDLVYAPQAMQAVRRLLAATEPPG